MKCHSQTCWPGNTAPGTTCHKLRNWYLDSVEEKPPDITILMQSAAQGDRHAADALLPLLYRQLRAAARQQLAAESPNHTLAPTELVHNAYLKLIGPRKIPWQNRDHFYTAAAQAMRRLLIDHARTKARREASPPPCPSSPASPTFHSQIPTKSWQSMPRSNAWRVGSPMPRHSFACGSTPA